MGDFNVACSVSRTSIREDDSVYYMPLVPRKTGFGKKRQRMNLKADGFLCYTDSYYTPFSLPIEGRYNGYGIIDNIVENANTKSIEKFFGITINKFVDVVRCQTEAFSIYNKALFIYALNDAADKYREIEDPDNFLKSIGFIKKENGRYIIENKKKYEVEIKDKKLNIYIGKKIVYDTEFKNILEKLCEFYYEKEKYYINIAEKNQKKVNILLDMSGMFIKKDVYEYLAEKQNKNVMKSFDILQTKLKEIREKEYKNKKTSLEYISLKCSLYSNGGSDYFMTYFRSWEYIRQLYEKNITDGELKEDFAKYYSFYLNLIDMNILLFPAFNGLQYGDLEKQRELASKTLEILNEKIKKEEAEDFY